MTNEIKNIKRRQKKKKTYLNSDYIKIKTK